MLAFCLIFTALATDQATLTVPNHTTLTAHAIRVCDKRRSHAIDHLLTILKNFGTEPPPGN